MRKILLFIFLAVSLISEAQTSISNLPTYTGDPYGGWIPIVVNGTTRKTTSQNVGNLDSLSIAAGTTYDTLKVYKNQVLKYYKLIRAAVASDTTSLSDRINLKLNIIDTASMLSSYTRVQRFLDSLSAHIAKIDSKFPADTSVVINNRINQVQSNLDSTRSGIRTDLNGKQPTLVSATNIKTINGASVLGSGDLVVSGGGSGDSSWASFEAGTNYNTLGTLLSTTFGSLPTGFTDNSPDASVTFSGGKMIVSGGTMDTIAIASSGYYNGAGYKNRLEVDSFYNYDKMGYTFDFVPQDKTSTSKFAFTFLPNSLFFSSSTDFVFDLTNDADSSGMIVIRPFASGTVYAVSNKLAWSIGDSMRVRIIHEGWYTAVVYQNRTTGSVVRTSYTGTTGFGTGGKAYFAWLGGTQHFTQLSVDSWNRNNYGIAFLGDSQFAGSGATSEDKTVPNLLFSGNKSRYSNLSNGSATLVQMRNSHVPNIIRLHPEYVIVTAGYNDRRDLATDTNTYRQVLDSAIQPIIRAGIPVILTTLVPTSNMTHANESNFTTAIINLATTYGLRRIRIDSALYISSSNVLPRPNMLAADNIHWSDSGQYLGYQKIKNQLPELDNYFKADTTSPVVFYELPTGNDNMNVIGVDARNRVFKFQIPKFDGIINTYNRNGAGEIAQANSSIYTSGTIKTDAGIYVHTPSGILIGGNGGTTSEAGTSGSNIVVSTRGVGGVGYPQSFPTIPGLRNVIFEPFSNKSGASATISGNDNFISNNSNAGTISGSRIFSISTGASMPAYTGSDIFAWGTDAMKGNISGSRVINLATRNTSGASVGVVSDLILFGDITSHNGGDNAYAANDISFNTSYYSNENIWLGGREKPEKIIYLNFPSISTVANYQGNDGYIRAGKGRGTGRSGFISFQTWDAAASGTTLQSVANTELTIFRDSIQFDAMGKFNSQIQVKVTTGISTGANYTVVATDYFLELPDLTAAAARNIVLPTNAGTGRVLQIVNLNNGANKWTFTGATVTDAAGAAITTLTDQKTYSLTWNGSLWRAIVQ